MPKRTPKQIEEKKQREKQKHELKRQEQLGLARKINHYFKRELRTGPLEGNKLFESLNAYNLDMSQALDFIELGSDPDFPYKHWYDDCTTARDKVYKGIGFIREDDKIIYYLKKH